MRCNWPWTAIAILAFSPQAGLAQTSVDRALIGVLEEVPCVYAGEASHFGVRVAFEHASGGWRALPHDCGNPACLPSIAAEYPQETRWTISSVAESWEV